jgi:hypothetical protein
MIDAGDPISALTQSLQTVRELRDLEAQIDMAFWAQAMFWTTVGTLLVTLILARSAFASFNQAQEATRLAREVGEYQTQAYVHAESAAYGQRGNILIYCKNGGATPASHFSICVNAKLVEVGNVTNSITFEGDEYKTWTSLAAGELRAASVLEGDPIVSQFYKAPHISQRLLVSGQIIYCSVFNHDHLTQFAFYVEPEQRKFRRPTANMVTFHRIDDSTPNNVSEVTLDDDREAD